MNALRETAAFLVGAQVRRLGLLVWPDPKGLQETDVRLHLDVEFVGVGQNEFTCRTDPDGQTPDIDMERWPVGIPFSRFNQRQRIWATDQFWKSPSFTYELFETAEEQALGVGVGAFITSAYIVKFVDDVPTGLVFEFDNGVQIWSAPSGPTGNGIGRKADDFCWPAKIELEKLQ